MAAVLLGGGAFTAPEVAVVPVLPRVSISLSSSSGPRLHGTPYSSAAQASRRGCVEQKERRIDFSIKDDGNLMRRVSVDSSGNIASFRLAI
eukprot:scaffold1992_cov187-Amphora_coffeaeformis.AAC.10